MRCIRLGLTSTKFLQLVQGASLCRLLSCLAGTGLLSLVGEDGKTEGYADPGLALINPAEFALIDPTNAVPTQEDAGLDLLIFHHHTEGKRERSVVVRGGETALIFGRVG